MSLHPVILILLALAIYRLSRLIIQDEITAPIREWIWKRFPPNTPFGYLFTCYRCVSMWVSVLVILLYVLFPTAMIVIALILALSATVGIISEHTN